MDELADMLEVIRALAAFTWGKLGAARSDQS